METEPEEYLQAIDLQIFYINVYLKQKCLINQPQKNKYDNLKLYNTYVTTALKCVPPGDKPTLVELKTCFNYFKQEIDLLSNVKNYCCFRKNSF